MIKDTIVAEDEINYKNLWIYQKGQAAMWEKLYEESSTAHQSTINQLMKARKHLNDILEILK
jgi:hypothetical protein